MFRWLSSMRQTMNSSITITMTVIRFDKHWTQSSVWCSLTTQAQRGCGSLQENWFRGCVCIQTHVTPPAVKPLYPTDLSQLTFDPGHLLLHRLPLELLHVLEVLVHVLLVLGEQSVEDYLPAADVDGGAEIFLQLPTRAVEVPAVVLLLLLGSGPPAAEEEQVPDVALLEVGQVREAGGQHVRHAGEVLVDVSQVADGEEPGPAHLMVPGHRDFPPLPL